MRMNGIERPRGWSDNPAAFDLHQEMQQLWGDPPGTGRCLRRAREINKSINRDHDDAGGTCPQPVEFSCPTRSVDLSLLQTNFWDVASRSKENPHQICLSVEFIVLLELTPKPAGFGAHDGVYSRVIRRAPIIYFDTDHILF